MTGFVGMVAVVLSGVNEHRREMAISRSVGAKPIHFFGLLAIESGIVVTMGAGIGIFLLYIVQVITQPLIETQLGLFIPFSLPTEREPVFVGLIIGAGFLSGIVPGYRAYRFSIADGMMVRT